MNMIVRFKAPERLAHWLHFVAFTVLLGTGMFIYLPALRAFATGNAGEAARLAHRIAALVFMLSPIIYLVFSPREFFESLREMFKWGPDDFAWLRGAAAYYTYGRKAQLPPQGKYNAGQKLNALTQFIAFGVFVVTGLLMWFGKGAVPVGVFRWVVILHDLAVIATTSLFVLHLYLVGIHPLTRESITAMVEGSVSEAYAKEHHTLWLEQVRDQKKGAGE